MVTTIYDLLQELQSFLTIPEEVLKSASESNINESNNESFFEELELWKNAAYDECPELLIQRLTNMLT